MKYGKGGGKVGLDLKWGVGVRSMVGLSATVKAGFRKPG